MKLELNPEIEAGLTAQAQAHGLSLEDYVAQVLQSAADVFVARGDDKWSVKKSKRERAGRKSLAQLFAESPFKGLDLNFERDLDTGRPIKL